jgi:hypothetical protein
MQRFHSAAPLSAGPNYILVVSEFSLQLLSSTPTL